MPNHDVTFEKMPEGNRSELSVKNKTLSDGAEGARVSFCLAK